MLVHRSMPKDRYLGKDVIAKKRGPCYSLEVQCGTLEEGRNCGSELA